jgi:hypothetical protein
VTVLANYGGHISNPDIPLPHRFLHAKDGTLYFTSGEQTKGPFGLSGGTQIHRFLPGQIPAHEKLLDLDGWPIAALTETRDGHLYGVSWGPAVIGSGENLEPRRQEQTEETLATKLAPRSAPARSTANRPRGTFRRTNPQDPVLRPVARPDRISLPARNGIRPVKAPVLRNDADPGRNPLSIVEVEQPEHGTATIEPGVGREPAHIVYTPSVWPPKSDIVSYTVANPQGKTSIGQLRIRPNLASRFRSPAASPATDATTFISLDSLVLNVRATGRFGGQIRLNGRNLPVSGRFNDADEVSMLRRFRRSEDQVQVYFALDSIDGVRQLHYEITYLGETLTGTIPTR